MSFEQRWDLPRVSPSSLEEAANLLARANGLECSLEAREEGELYVEVRFPADEDTALRLALELSDVWDDEEMVLDQLDPPRVDIDWDAARSAGAVEERVEGGLRSMTLLFEDDAFVLPREAYVCSFTVDWDDPPPVNVYSNENDNRLAWPLILAFTDGVVEKLGGEWVECLPPL